MPRTVYYLSTEDRLQPGDTYRKHGVTPVVILAKHGANLFTWYYDWKPSVAACEGLGIPYWVALRAEDAMKRRALAPWEDAAAWIVLLENLKRLVLAAPRCAGICFDGEIYSATPGGSGGLMDKSAWPAGVWAEARGRQVRAVLGGKRLGQYVLVSDAKGHEGWRQFWGGAYQPGDLLLDEAGYLTGASRAKAFLREGVVNLPGRTIRGGRLVGRLPAGDVWLYPWDGDGPGRLDGVSAKWLK